MLPCSDVSAQFNRAAANLATRVSLDRIYSTCAHTGRLQCKIDGLQEVNKRLVCDAERMEECGRQQFSHLQAALAENASLKEQLQKLPTMA
eukprot:9169153-Karenia_brevis.AAC.1